MSIITVLALLVKVIAQSALHLPIAQNAIQGIIYLLQVVRFHFIIIIIIIIFIKKSSSTTTTYSYNYCYVSNCDTCSSNNA